MQPPLKILLTRAKQLLISIKKDLSKFYFFAKKIMPVKFVKPEKPISTHPLLCRVLSEWGLDQASMEAALLHDLPRCQRSLSATN